MALLQLIKKIPDIDTIIFIQFEKDVVLNGLMVDRIKLSSI
jgi:hypothetical protein